ncbi:MAG: glycine zipper 2TM domain-containing protein [Pelagimonas sp.]
MRLQILTVSSVITLISACTAPVDRPLTVDGPRAFGYDADYAACYNLASGFTDGTPREGATTGAVLGGIVGALDASDGDKIEGAVVGAAAGALIGSAEAHEKLTEERRDVLIRCMQNRGHRVVG